MRRVLVTRPQPGADETATRVAAMGFAPVLLPLTRIMAVEPQRLPDPANVDAVTVTSANALRHVPGALLAALAAKPVFAVGDATAAAAERAGFHDVRSASATARELAALIGGAVPRGGRVLHLTGTVRTAGFEEDLRGRGLEVGIVEFYCAEPIEHADADLADRLAGGAIWGATVLSTRAGELLAALAARAAAQPALQEARFFCISDKAAAPLLHLGAERVSVSAEPTEEGVLALLSP